MNVYIARQPIFDRQGELTAYELLYRESESNAFISSLTGSDATKSLVSDAMTVFGLSQLTNAKRAFINFTRPLLMEDFAYLLDSNGVVIEILEDTKVTDDLIDKVKKLHEDGYQIAIDDYTGEAQWEPLFDYIDIIKVDFILVNNLDERAAIGARFKGSNIKLLAEKVETAAEFAHATSNGYSLFQGYYFAKPKMLAQKAPDASRASYTRIMQELDKRTPSFDVVSDIIAQDVSLSYKVLKKINSMQYHRGFEITNVHSALVKLGFEETRRWILLMMAKSLGANQNDELIKLAFVRAVFAEKLAKRVKSLSPHSAEAFNLGMFSLIDVILETDMAHAIEELPLTENVRSALMGEKNALSNLLEFVKGYESGDWSGNAKTSENNKLTSDAACEMYLSCVVYADKMFRKD
ncbi:MAG: HDOD domain-containing protein [Oscillospiraceae bacterium]